MTPNIVKALTLNILTSGYEIYGDSKPFALIYRVYYRLLGSQLNPHARIKDLDDKTILIQCSSLDAQIQLPKMIQWQDINLPKEWLLEQETPLFKPVFDELNLNHIQQYLDEIVKISFNSIKPLMINEGRHSFVGSKDVSKRDQDLNEFLQKNFEKPDLKLKGVSSNNSQVSTAFYSTKTKPPSTHSKHAIEEEETKSGSPIASDFQTPIIHSQLRVLNKSFVVDMISLFNVFKSAKNKEKRKSYHATFDQKEKDHVKSESRVCLDPQF